VSTTVSGPALVTSTSPQLESLRAAQSSGIQILVAEDDPIQRMVLVELLKGKGNSVLSASDGAAAWEQLSRSDCSILFTDWMMPKMTGPDLIRKIRAADLGRYIYIILCTSKDSRADLIEGMKCGADDYIEKPVDEDELLVRLAAGKRVTELEHRLEQDNRKLVAANHSLTRAYDTIREDLEAAARMQRSLLPAPSTIHDMHCNSLFLPATGVAGDIFNFFSLNQHSAGFYLLDVSGHGIPAAMLSVTLSKALAPRPSQGSPLVRPAPDGTFSIRPPNEAISELNRRFQDQGDLYFTMVYGDWDRQSHRLRLAQAGHPEPILVRQGLPPQALGNGGFPVGVLPEMTYDLLECQMEPGDRLYVSSDGILECANHSGEQFGLARLMEFVDRHRASTLEDLLQQLEVTMREWLGATEGFDDDVSLLALEAQSPKT